MWNEEQVHVKKITSNYYEDYESLCRKLKFPSNSKHTPQKDFNLHVINAISFFEEIRSRLYNKVIKAALVFIKIISKYIPKEL